MKLLTAIAFTFLIGTSVQAQRIACVDVAQILESVSEYQNAQTELDKLSDNWRQDIAQEYDKIKSMYNRYQAEQVLLTEDVRSQREEEIMDAEKRVRDMQKRRFGPEGDLFKRRQEMVQPIQERVYAAIEAYANDRGFDFIFDKGGASGMLFSNERYDKTEDIMRSLK